MVFTMFALELVPNVSVGDLRYVGWFFDGWILPLFPVCAWCGGQSGMSMESLCLMV